MNIPINVDPQGFIWYDGVKLPCRYLPERSALEFFDKDRRRSEKRGARTIEIPLNQFAETLASVVMTAKTVYNDK